MVFISVGENSYLVTFNTIDIGACRKDTFTGRTGRVVVNKLTNG